MPTLKDKKIAVLVAPLYEDMEFWYPKYRMEEEGAQVVVIGPERAQYTGKKGMPAEADKSIDDVRAIEFDAVIVPGGYAPDHMRRSPKMIAFVSEMNKQRKPIASICHGPWVLASAGALEGKQVTSFHSIKDDIANAGAEWVDMKVVKSDNVITSRVPADLPAFCTAIIEVLRS